jgi:hypothetical protein
LITLKHCCETEIRKRKGFGEIFLQKNLLKLFKMYEPEEDYANEEEESEEIQNELWQEACWIVISAYFEEKGSTLF